MRRAAFGLVVALIFPAAARADFTPPEVFVAEGDSSSTQGSPPVWQPLEGARLTGAYRYRPGGCASVRGTAGDIVQFAQASYYGDGHYQLTVALAPYASGPCPASGVASSGTFSVDARPTLTFEGEPRAHGARRSPRRSWASSSSTTASVSTGPIPPTSCASQSTVAPPGGR